MEDRGPMEVGHTQQQAAPAVFFACLCNLFNINPGCYEQDKCKRTDPTFVRESLRKHSDSNLFANHSTSPRAKPTQVFSLNSRQIDPANGYSRISKLADCSLGLKVC